MNDDRCPRCGERILKMQVMLKDDVLIEWHFCIECGYDSSIGEEDGTGEGD